MSEQKLIYVEPECNYKDTPKYIFVGDAPGKDKEDSFLRETLEKFFNLSQQSYYITHAIKVRPSGDRTLTNDELISWCNTLADEIENVDLKEDATVIAVGSVAKQALDIIGVDNHFIFHPSYVMTLRTKFSEWVEQIRSIDNDY